MKEENKYIDKLFNEALNNRSFDIPEPFMDDLNKRLDAVEKKKRRGFFWWFVLLIGTTGLSLLVAFLSQRPFISSEQLTTNNTTIVDAVKKHNNDIRSPYQQQTKQQQIKGNDSVHATEEPDISISAPINPQPGKYYTEANNKAIKENSKITGKKADQSSYNYPIKSTEKSIAEQETANTHTPPPLKHSIIFDNTVSESLKSTIQDFGMSDSILTDVPDEHLSNTDSIPTSNESSAEEETTSTIQGVAQPTHSTNEEVKTTGNRKIEIQAYGGIGTLFYFDQSDTSSYAKQLQGKQSRFNVPDIGLNGHFSHKNITFGLGINYNQTGEKYATTVNEKFLKDSIDYYTTYDTIYYYDSINDTWEIQEIVEVIEQYITQHEDSILKVITVKNVYSWVSIPLYFGYRFQAGAFEFIPRVGVQLNFGVARRIGDYPGFLPQSITQFRSKAFSLSYLIQVEIRRNFKDHWHVFVNPYFKSAFTPAISTSVFNRKYSSLGIQLGIGYTFRKLKNRGT